MSSKWRNLGAEFTTTDGTLVGTGDTFQAHPKSRDVVRRRKKLAPVAPGAPVTTPESRLPGVDFGSDVAYELAREAGLNAADFAGRKGSGVDGAFLKADVEALADG